MLRKVSYWHVLRHAAMSAQWSLSGGKRTSRGSPISVVIDPKRTRDLARRHLGMLGSAELSDGWRRSIYALVFQKLTSEGE